MKKKVIILSVLLLSILSNLHGQNWDEISKDIHIKQIKITQKDNYTNLYSDLRKVSGNLNRFSSIMKNDTILIIEAYGTGDGIFKQLYSIVWNKSDTIFCVSKDAGKTYNFEKNDLFTKYMMKLVGEWNISEIRREESINGGSIPQDMDCATRIIFNGKDYHIDCIYFRDFFDIKRDSMDFK